MDVYTPREIGRAAGVDEGQVLAALHGAGHRGGPGRYVSHTDAVRIGRSLVAPVPLFSLFTTPSTFPGGAPRLRLTVRGTVRNPPGRAAINRLTVVVLVFSHEGGFASSGRAIIDVRTLAPGAASPFTVDIPGVNDVGRFRVSLRTDEGIVEHIDKREP